MSESLAVRRAGLTTAITRVHEVLDTFASRDHTGEILTAIRHFPAREAQWADFPAGVDPGREVRPLRFAGREMANRREDFAGVVARSESIQHFVDAGDCGRQASSTNGERFRHLKPLSCHSLFIRQRYHRPFADARWKSF